MFSVVVATPVASQPVTGTEAKAWCRVEGTADDTLIDGLISGATEWAQAYTGRQLITATFDATFEDWPCDYIEYPKPPLSSVSYIKYYDVNGTQQTWASSNYVVDTAMEPGRVIRASSSVLFPLLYPRLAAVTTRFVCGYGTSGQVPEAIKTAIKIIVSTNYEYRENQSTGGPVLKVPFAVESLLNPYKTWLAGLT